MKILFIDEDHSFASVYAHSLHQTGDYEVTTVPDSRTALTYLNEHPDNVDAIITEVLLPGRNGLKLIQDIRLQERWLETPVYILTTLEAADIGLAESLRVALGVKAYLIKQRTSPSALADILKLVEARG